MSYFNPEQGGFIAFPGPDVLVDPVIFRSFRWSGVRFPRS